MSHTQPLYRYESQHSLEPVHTAESESPYANTRQIGRDGKFNAKTFEEAIVEIIETVTHNPHERMMDERPNACKV